MSKLLIKEGPGQGDFFELSQSKITIGRDPQCTFHVDDRTVSRAHARIIERGEGYFVRDLDSHNGTLVNGERISRKYLSHMDEIRLGNVALIFLEDDATDVSALLQSQDKEPEVTQTLNPEEALSVAQLTGGNAEELIAANQRLLALTKLSQASATIKSLPPLFDLLADSIATTLDPDRAVPIVRQEDGSLLPYVRAKSAFDKSLESIGISKATVEHCLKMGVATLSEGARKVQVGDDDSTRRPQISSVLCAPLKIGQTIRGVIYCDRVEHQEKYTRADLQYLCSLAAQIAVAMENIRAYERMEMRARNLERQVQGQYDIVGQSPQVQEVFEFIRKAAPTRASVLICGESGTGKELVARAIHYQSSRSNGPFEAVNCAAMSPTLIESELFGHVKGAYTGAVSDRPGRFELAHQGTIFLDEIGALPLDCQTKLLRVLESGILRRVGDVKDRRVDARVIAATNQDLDAAKDQKAFREDLFYRLNVLRTDLPPMRERGDDVELLAEVFLEEFSEQCGRTLKGYDPKVLECFRRYAWPGNVRELKNIVERMVIMCEAEALGTDLLPAEFSEALQEAEAAPAPQPEQIESLQDVEKRYILDVLRMTGGNKKKAAEILGVDRSTLYAKLKRYGV